mgnify:CR=1 FL=1
MMVTIDNDTMQDFILWLRNREEDIANGREDFGDLRELFHQVFDRNADEPPIDTPLW